VRQLELVTESAVVSALADALRAPGEEAPRVVPVGAKLVRDLVQAGDAMGGPPAAELAAEELAPDEIRVHLAPADGLRDVSRQVERQYMETLYRRTGGDFARMADILLGDPTARGSRRVRLRFNQLGLRVRSLD
jgi:hypothetical protein